jgi:hypothetical protein
MDPELITPTDELTDIPLPLIESAELPSYEWPTPKPDWHHAFHPARSEVLTQDLAGKALRACRVQLVGYNLHHMNYHEQFHGPALPETEEEKFRLIVLAAAGYVPEQGLTFDAHGEPIKTRISSEQRADLQNGKLKLWNYRTVRDFLQDYVLRQDLTSVNQLTIEEFLTTPDPTRRWELGCTLLGRATAVATEPIKDVYKEARTSDRLSPQVRAQTAARFVLGRLIMKRERLWLVDKLHYTLLDS